MLSIQQQLDRSKPKSVIPNVLPCEISYTGKTESIKQFWNPQIGSIKDANEKDTQVEVAYFRGRKLLGRTAQLPEDYRGVVVSGEKQSILQEQAQQESAFSRIARRDADDDEDPADVSDEQTNVQHEAMNEISTFDKVTVWEHDMIPDTQDPFVRGTDEWISFAHTIHNTDS